MSSADTQKNILALARSASAGDEAAFTLFYDQYMTPIYRYVLVRVRNKHEADDLTQVVFLKAYQHLATFSQEASKPLAYLYAIARNTIIDHWKKRREVSQVDAEDVFEKAPDERRGPNEQIQQHEVAERVRTALGHLTQEQRDAVSLKYLNDFSTTEIARQMGKSEAAVRQLLSRGLRALRPHINS